jgi:hypothetical protein
VPVEGPGKLLSSEWGRVQSSRIQFMFEFKSSLTMASTRPAQHAMAAEPTEPDGVGEDLKIGKSDHIRVFLRVRPSARVSVATAAWATARRLSFAELRVLCVRRGPRDGAV